MNFCSSSFDCRDESHLMKFYKLIIQINEIIRCHKTFDFELVLGKGQKRYKNVIKILGLLHGRDLRKVALQIVHAIGNPILVNTESTRCICIPMIFEHLLYVRFILLNHRHIEQRLLWSIAILQRTFQINPVSLDTIFLSLFHVIIQILRLTRWGKKYYFAMRMRFSCK